MPSRLALHCWCATRPVASLPPRVAPPSGLSHAPGTAGAHARASRQIKNLNATEAQKKPIVEINLERALQGLELTMAQAPPPPPRRANAPTPRQLRAAGPAHALGAASAPRAPALARARPTARLAVRGSSSTCAS